MSKCGRQGTLSPDVHWTGALLLLIVRFALPVLTVYPTHSLSLFPQSRELPGSLLAFMPSQAPSIKEKLNWSH